VPVVAGESGQTRGKRQARSSEVAVTTPDQLREIVHYLQGLVVLDSPDERTVVFNAPDAERMIADGLDEHTVHRLLDVPWWSEMVDDIIETPDFAAPEEPPEAVLGYARDVIQEYVGKQFPLND
jgi:hypothetical protein